MSYLIVYSLMAPSNKVNRRDYILIYGYVYIDISSLYISVPTWPNGVRQSVSMP